METENFMNFIKSRRSVRKYTGQKINREQIEQLIEAASWAPSNHNRQGWKFIIFQDEQEIRMLAEQCREYVRIFFEIGNKLLTGHADELIYFAGLFENAPLVILAMNKKSSAVSRELLELATSKNASGEFISTAMACQNILLTANAMGLGACVMTAPLLAGKIWNSLKDLPLGFEPTCLITIGYSAESPPEPRRKKLEHIIEYR